ncbi:AMP-binding protein [Streptomyces sp. NPDC088400]|uniref:AMP-binding protein n=1 Tax=Streptomyces sp. NPDC088400 TaxID=3365861 RepID=UPI0038129BB4
MVQGHARLRPDAVAVESGGTLLTYRELWHRAIAVPAVLDEAGVGAGDRVVLWADRPARTVAGTVA